MHSRTSPVLATFAMACLLASGLDARGLALAPRSQAGAPQPSTNAQALDQLLAPIALYPDQLLAQMLMCATDPVKVRQLDAFLKNNASLKGTELQQALRDKGFEPSFVMLALFPDVVARMAIDQAGTQQLGEAFASDRAGVLESIQRLRAQSQAAGTLRSNEQQTVETKTTSSGQSAIVIEPANPQVVYVPQYNPTTVYTTAPTSTVVVQQQSSSTGAAVAGAAVGFAVGVAIGAAFDNDYYYGRYGWHGGPAMYNDAWDDYYDHRDDARDDFYDNREDARDNYNERRENANQQRSERASTQSQQRTERTETRSQQSTERQQTRQESRPQTQAEAQQRRTEAQGRAEQARSSGAASSPSAQSRGAAREGRAAPERSGTRSDAFSNYSSGRSERAASSRGKTSRSSSGGSRGGRRR